MAINIEVTFTDAVTVVDASWLNLLQEHLAGLSILNVDIPTTTQVRILAGDDDDVAAVYIGGQHRRRDTNVAFNFTTEPSAIYGMFVTAPAGVDTFEVEVTTGTPGVSPFRKVAEVDWNGSAIESLRMLEGRNLAHDHGLLDGAGQVAHADLTDFGGDPHTQLSLVDGSRAFTGNIDGITPSTDDELATKGYVDGIATPGLPIGSIVPLGSEVVPGGWLMCDGTQYTVAAFGALHAVTGDAFGGDGGSNFNVPDFRDALPLGKAASGTGSSMGDAGGDHNHTHSQATHTHTGNAHTHTTSSHNHLNPSSGGPSAEHTHTQSITGSTGNHGHTGPSHTHTATGLSVGGSSKEVVGSAHSSQATAGIYGEDAVDTFSTSTSHSHGDGSYSIPTFGNIFGSSSSNSASHNHLPSGNSFEHTHVAGSLTGTATAANYNPVNTGNHTHTNPTTAASTGGHTHGGGTSGGATPNAASGAPGSTGADGDDASGTAEVPFLVMSYIIRAT